MSGDENDRKFCGGLPGRCLDCIELYHRYVGSVMPWCVLCDSQHWAYEDHGKSGAMSPDSSPSPQPSTVSEHSTVDTPNRRRRLPGPMWESSEMTTADEGEHTAAVLIRIYPAGASGQVYVTVTTEGPATPLTNDEVLRTLRMAIAVVEDREPSTETTSLLRGLASAEGSGMTEIEPGRFYVDKQLPPPVPRRLAP